MIDPWAASIINRIDTYTERSPSGTGVKMLAEGNLPEGRRRKGHVEMYTETRYFTLSGAWIEGTPREVEERNDVVAALHAEFLAGGKPKKDADETVVEDQKPRPEPAATSNEEGAHEDDDALIAKAKRAKNGSKFRALWDGSTSAYGDDDSAADLALCDMLAWWLGRDHDRVDRAFRQSRLMRPKWNENRGEKTYGDMTIDLTIKDCDGCYTPRKKEKEKASTNGDGVPPEGDHPQAAGESGLTGYSIIASGLAVRTCRPRFGGDGRARNLRALRHQRR